MNVYPQPQGYLNHCVHECQIFLRLSINAYCLIKMHFTCQAISLHARQFLQCCIVLSSISCVSDFVKAKLWLCTFKHKRATYTLSMSKPSSHSAGSGERRKHVMANKLHTTSATLKIKHADTSLWLPAAKLLHARQFLQCCIVWSSLSCVSDFVKAKLWLCTFKHKRATYQLSMSEPMQQSQCRKWRKRRKTCDD